jgi:hypothetical protein
MSLAVADRDCDHDQTRHASASRHAVELRIDTSAGVAELCAALPRRKGRWRSGHPHRFLVGGRKKRGRPS